MSKRILVIVPAYNEQESIENVYNALLKYSKGDGYELDALVVNDCSKDNTLEVLRKIKAMHLSLPVNLGIGGAVQAGFRYAYNNNYDFAIQVDGDGQHPAEELFKLIEPALKNEADIIIGSRFLTKKGFQSSYARRLGIGFFTKLIKFLLGITVYDTTSGFRLFNRDAIKLASRYYPDEYPEPEVIVYFTKKGLKIKEVPVVMKERQGGVSSISPVKSIYYMIKVSLGILFVYFRFYK